MQWGDPSYCSLHRRAWEEAWRVLIPGGLMILNVSNHIRKGHEVPVVEWHRETLEDLGFIIEDDKRVGTPRFRHGENHEARVEGEHVIVGRRS